MSSRIEHATELKTETGVSKPQESTTFDVKMSDAEVESVEGRKAPDIEVA